MRKLKERKKTRGTWKEGKLLRSFYIDRYENSRSLDSVIKLMERGERREEHKTVSHSLSFSLFLSPPLPFPLFLSTTSA